MNNKISFEIDNFSVVDDYSDEQLATVEVWVCHDGNNHHNLPIPLEALRKATKTLKNKFLVGGYSGKDFEGHEKDEQIIGFFPESSKMEIKEKDGKNYLVAYALMSKLYAKWAYDIFTTDNQRDVSMEISVLDYEEDEKSDLKKIKEFIFNGVTVLGRRHMPACEGASATIIKFSQNLDVNLNKKYFKNSKSIKSNFVSEMSKQREEEKMEEKEINETPYMEEKVKEVPAEEVKAEEIPVEEVKVEEVSAEVEKTEEEPKEDFEENKSLTVDQKMDIFRSAISELVEDFWIETFDDNYIYVHMYKESVTYRMPYSLNGTNVEIKLDEREKVTRGGYQVFETEKEEEKVEETETPKEEVKYTIEQIETMEKEISNLNEKVKEYEDKEKEDEINSILAEVKDTIPEDKMEELKVDACNYSLDEMNVFRNNVKAVAFEFIVKDKNVSTIHKMSIDKIEKEKKFNW